MHVVYVFKENGNILKRVDAPLDDILKENFLKENRFVWLDLVNPGEEELKFLEEKIGVHALEIEDALNVEEQSAKINETRNHLFVTFLNPIVKEDDEIKYENLAFFIFKNIIITIRDRKYSLFNKTIRRIYSKSKILKDRVSIMHIFLDVIIDELIFIVDKLDDEVNELERKILTEENEEEALEELYNMKIRVMELRKLLISQKEIIYALTKQSKFISSKQVVYFKDLYEHITLLIGQLDLLRDTTNTLLQTYISIASQNTNEVMRVLTVITSIFLPLTLITGIYGMNFKYMPELYYKYAYFIALGVMLIIAISLIIIYKRKGWI